MNQQSVEPIDEESTESLFRRVMAGATDGTWDLGVDEEALAALHDVVDEGIRRKEDGESNEDNESNQDALLR